MLTFLTVLAAYTATFCAVFLVQLSRARVWSIDRAIGWFLAANASSDLVTNLVILLVLMGALHGRAGGYALATALVVEAAFYTWRVYLGRQMGGGHHEVQN